MEATPRSPDQAVTPICRKDDRKGARMRRTLKGLPIRVRKTIMRMAGISTGPN